MAKAQRISISAAAKLLGMSRATIAKNVESLHFVRGPKGAKLYDGDSLMRAIYLGGCDEESSMIFELSDAMDDL